MINITLIPIAEFKFNGKGKYLVRTESIITGTHFKSVQYLSARVDLNENGKVSIDVSGQIVTHISSDRILDDSIFGGKDMINEQKTLSD